MVWSACNTMNLDLCPSFVGVSISHLSMPKVCHAFLARVAGQPVEKVELQEGISAFHAWSAAVFFVSSPTDNVPGR